MNLILDANERLVSRSVGWHFQRSVEEPDFAATYLFWTLPEAGPWHAGLERADFDFSSLSRPAGAVKATLELDGAVAVRENILDQQLARRLRTAHARGATLRLDTGGSSAASVYAASSARILVESEGGRRMSIVRVRFPDWPLVDRQVTEALTALGSDALDFTNKCERETGPEIDLLGFR